MDESEYSPQPVRNPSPPPELKQNEEAVCGDSIGGTAFSKHWLFTTLMKLIQEVDKETEAKEGLESSSEFGVDVDEELQTELCKLWDMSMNSDVAKFLQEFKAVDILTGVISKSQAPRVTEICVGILGNMACDQQVCEEIANNEKLVHLVLELLSNSDPPTLVETTRLLYTSLSTKSVRHFWLEAVSQAEGFKEQVAFLFHSSTNCDLLKNTADFLDTLLDLSDDLCSGWASTDLVDALLEAIQQIGYKHSETLEVFLHIFQLLSTSQEGVQALVERGEEVLMPLLQYLECVCQDEIVGLEEHSACLSSVFSLLNALFMSDSAIVEKLSTSAHLLRCMLKVLEPLYPIVHHVDVNSTTNQSVKAAEISTAAPSQESATTNPTLLSKDKETGTDSKSRREKSQGERMDEQGDAEDVKEVTKAEGAECGDSGRAEVKDMSEIDAEEMRQFQTLFDVLQAFLRDFIWSLQVDQNEQEGSGDESSTASNVPLFLPALKYLDSACSRCRINYLALTIAKPNATTDSVKTATTTTDNTSKPAGSSAAAESQDKSASTDSPVQVTLSGDLSLVLHLKQLCLTFGQTRVARILDDVMSGRVVKRAESTVL